MAALVGQKCPDFPVEFASKANEMVQMSSICENNEIVILDFYTNWCKACPDTAKMIDEMASKNKNEKVRFLLVNLENDMDDAKEFFETHGLKHAESCIVDDDKLPASYQVAGIPHKVVVKNNVVIANGPDVALTDFDVETGAFKSGSVNEARAPSPTLTPSAPGDKVTTEYMGSRISKEWKSYEANEPILKDNPQRWVMFPIKHQAVWEMYKQHEASFWTAEEIDLSQDNVDWDKLNANEQHFLKHILAFFAGSDGIVLENLGSRFTTEVQIPEARAFYGFQMAMENIHSETYSLLIDQYLRNDEEEKHRLFNAISTIPVIQAKADWAAKWMNDDSSFAERLVGFAAVEGILFSGSFCAIYWLKKRGMMPGLTFSNELIARDEGLHADFACLLYSMLEKPLPAEIVQDVIRGAVDVERTFICDALSCDLIGMNKALMETYIQFVADRLLTALNVPKIYNVKNPFDWMELISLQGKTNFFEKRVGDYQKAGVATKQDVGEGEDANQHAFSMDEDF